MNRSKKLGKKGFEWSGILIWIILAVIFILFMLYLQSDKIAKPLKRTDSETLKLQMQQCQLKAEMAKSQAIQIADEDKDGCADDIDPCLGTEGEKTTDDSDIDGMPDVCETVKTAKNPNKIICKHRIDGSAIRCCTDDYKAKEPGSITCKNIISIFS